MPVLKVHLILVLAQNIETCYREIYGKWVKDRLHLENLKGDAKVNLCFNNRFIFSDINDLVKTIKMFHGNRENLLDLINKMERAGDELCQAQVKLS